MGIPQTRSTSSFNNRRRAINNGPAVRTASCIHAERTYQSPPTEISTTRQPRLQRQRRLPVRYRAIYSEVNSESAIPSLKDFKTNNTVSTIMNNKNRRTAAQKKRRRQREQGPWPCVLCKRQPFRSISGLRDHVIAEHLQYCSWSGRIRAFTSEEENFQNDQLRRRHVE
jgi:hypothetical protein